MCIRDRGPPQQNTAVMTPSAKDQLCWKTAEASHRGWLEWNSTWSGIAPTTASSFHTTLTTLSVLLCTSLPCQFWSVQTWLPFQFRCVQTWISSLDTILSADMYDQQAHSFFSSFFLLRRQTFKFPVFFSLCWLKHYYHTNRQIKLYWVHIITQLQITAEIIILFTNSWHIIT